MLHRNGHTVQIQRPIEAAAEFREALENIDIEKVRLIWAEMQPDMPQPKTDQEALCMIHHARTQANSIMFKLRAYSHAWLTERSLPSGLPDGMRPRAQRMYPVVVSAVGIAVGSPPNRKEEANALRTAMSNTVLEAYADGITDHERIRNMIRKTRLNFKG